MKSLLFRISFMPALPEFSLLALCLKSSAAAFAEAAYMTLYQGSHHIEDDAFKTPIEEALL